MRPSAEVATLRDVLDVVARERRLEVEADLRIDSPFGPLRLQTEEGARSPAGAPSRLVIGVDGWGSVLRMSWSALFGALRPGRSLLSAAATATGANIYLDPGRGPRIRVARPQR